MRKYLNFLANSCLIALGVYGAKTDGNWYDWMFLVAISFVTGIELEHDFNRSLR